MLPHSARKFTLTVHAMIASAWLVGTSDCHAGDCVDARCVDALCVDTSCAAPCAIVDQMFDVVVPPAVPTVVDASVSELALVDTADHLAGKKHSQYPTMIAPPCPQRDRALRAYYPTVMPETNAGQREWNRRDISTAFDLKLGENIVR